MEEISGYFFRDSYFTKKKDDNINIHKEKNIL